MKKLAIFVSGTGSNAEKIIRHFKESDKATVRLLVSNKPDAPALAMAEKYGVETLTLDRQSFFNTKNILYELQNRRVDFIVLAGFLWKVPPYLVAAYEGKMVNIHPALLPKFGGKGMYGASVHEAVKAAGEKETGITIHLVNERFDEGEIIFQAACEVNSDDTPASIAKKVQQLEHKYFPIILEKMLTNKEVRDE